MAAGVRSAAEKIVRENGLDMEEARKGGRNAAFLDRLLLTPERVEHMARGMEQVAVLPDPVGECIREWTRPNGLHIRQVRVPLGVIGFIYESRGTVTCDAAALCLKSGNAVILRGGSESLRTTGCWRRFCAPRWRSPPLPRMPCSFWIPAAVMRYGSCASWFLS